MSTEYTDTRILLKKEGDKAIDVTNMTSEINIAIINKTGVIGSCVLFLKDKEGNFVVRDGATQTYSVNLPLISAIISHSQIEIVLDSSDFEPLTLGVEVLTG